MKSRNPFSGCHPEDVCHTIDATVPNPSKGQGGMAIVEMSTPITGGVQVVFRKTARPKAAGESPTYKQADVTNTLNTFDLGSGARVNELVVESVGRGSTEI